MRWPTTTMPDFAAWGLKFHNSFWINPIPWCGGGPELPCRFLPNSRQKNLVQMRAKSRNDWNWLVLYGNQTSQLRSGHKCFFFFWHGNMIELNGALSITTLDCQRVMVMITILWTVGCHFANSSSTWYIGSGEDEGMKIMRTRGNSKFYSTAILLKWFKCA